MTWSHWLRTFALTGCVPAQSSHNAGLAFTPAHMAHLRVGLRDVVVQFRGWPLGARKSLDIVSAPSGGSTQGLPGRLALIRLDGEIDTATPIVL